MGENTKISWADNTFNPWIGCMKIGPGCDNCYAEESMPAKFMKIQWGAGKPRHRTSKTTWKEPLKWNRKAEKEGKQVKVFGGSLCDPFDNEVPKTWRDDYWKLIKATPNLTWIIVTKRMGNVKKMLSPDWGNGYQNVWLCITVATQTEYDRDIKGFTDIPAVVRGLSIEPQLEPIHLNGGPWVDWVICGCESGPGARPFNEDWARSLRDQCQASGTAFFFKQTIRDGKKVETPEMDGQRWVEFPDTSVLRNSDK